MNTMRQYEPITLPAEATPSERRAWQRLTEILDDIYLKYGRLTLSDLGKETVTAINRAGVFDSAQIRDLQATLARFATAEMGGVTIGQAQVEELSARLLTAVQGDMARAGIGQAQIESLTAQLAEIYQAKVTEASVGDLSAAQMYADILTATTAALENVRIENLSAAMATLSFTQVAQAVIRQAKIHFLNVEDLTAGSAVFRMGTGGELYIDRLTVNEGNLVSLSAGKLMVKGVDGKWYTLQVGSDGITPIRVEEPVTDDNIGDGTLSGGKIVEGSINVDRLNAATIQGNQAFLVELTAGLGNFGTLFANEAIAEQLKTHLIHSDYLKVVIQSGENVAAYFEFLDSGLRISAPGSQFYIQISNEEIGFFQSGVKVAWITGSMLHMPRAKIESELQIGQFSWVKESNGSLSLQYV